MTSALVSSRAVRVTPRQLAVLFAVADAVAFALVRPSVPDMQAALARAEAAAHGVGLTYWFGWFSGGTVPGQYSVTTPWLSAVLGPAVLGALATAAITPLAGRALVGTRHRTAGMWAAAATTGLSLWSGRIAFAVGTACAVVAIAGLRERRVVVASVAAVASVACSPVCGAFLALGLGGHWIVSRRGPTAAVLAVCLASLGCVALYFGTPGPQILRPATAALITGCSLAMLLARPSRSVRVVAVVTALASPLLLVIPTGMGSNLARMTYICLPIAVIATGRARRSLVALAVAPALVVATCQTVRDVRAGLRPTSAPSYYASLARQLDRTPGLLDERLQVVQSPGAHAASYTLLGHASLATGWETQAQQALDPVLTTRTLGAAGYRRWLDDNAVGFVALDRRSPDTTDPQYDLVRRGLPYLRPVWHDATWTLFALRHPRPIVAAPARVLHASQAQLRVTVPCTCSIALQLHWSRFLEAVDPVTGRPAGAVTRRGADWSTLTVTAPGTVVLQGGG